MFWQECIKWALTNNTISVTWTLVQTKCSQKALPEEMLYKRYVTWTKKNWISVTWTLNSLLEPCELKLTVKKKNKNILKYMKIILFFLTWNYFDSDDVPKTPSPFDIFRSHNKDPTCKQIQAFLNTLFTRILCACQVKMIGLDYSTLCQRFLIRG